MKTTENKQNARRINLFDLFDAEIAEISRKNSRNENWEWRVRECGLECSNWFEYD